MGDVSSQEKSPAQRKNTKARDVANTQWSTWKKEQYAIPGESDW